LPLRPGDAAAVVAQREPEQHQPLAVRRRPVDVGLRPETERRLHVTGRGEPRGDQLLGARRAGVVVRVGRFGRCAQRQDVGRAVPRAAVDNGHVGLLEGSAVQEDRIDTGVRVRRGCLDPHPLDREHLAGAGAHALDVRARDGRHAAGAQVQQDAEDAALTVGQGVGGDLRLRALAVAGITLGGGWEAGARFRLVSGNPTTPILGTAYYDADADTFVPRYGEPGSERLPLFHQLDLRVDKKWTFAHWSLSVYLDVQNVYNRQNPEATLYNFDYTESTTVSGLPILPSLGVRGEL